MSAASSIVHKSRKYTVGELPDFTGIVPSSRGSRTIAFIGTIGYESPTCRLPEGLTELPLVRAVMTSSAEMP
jgi:hypothetical protein